MLAGRVQKGRNLPRKPEGEGRENAARCGIPETRGGDLSRRLGSEVSGGTEASSKIYLPARWGAQVPPPRRSPHRCEVRRKWGWQMSAGRKAALWTSFSIRGIKEKWGCVFLPRMGSGGGGVGPPHIPSSPCAREQPFPEPSKGRSPNPLGPLPGASVPQDASP